MTRHSASGIALSSAAFVALFALGSCTAEPEEPILDEGKAAVANPAVAPTVATDQRNLARDPGVVATAQSSFPGYAPAKAIDGDLSTVVGPEHSWANADSYGPDGRVPQWLQVALPADRVVEGFNLYTSGGYPLQNFDIDAWDGAAWRNLVQQRGNTQLVRSYTVPATTSHLVRVVGFRGPENQPQYVRVNELEILGRDVDAPPDTTVISSGPDWQRVQITAGGSAPVNEVLAIVKTGPNVGGAPLPQSLKDELVEADPDQTFVISDWVAQDIAVAEQTGALTPRLAEIAEADDSFAFTARCPDQVVSKQRSIHFSGPLSRSTSSSGAVVGTLSVSAGINASVDTEVRFAKKRFKLFRWCIPYGYSFLGGDLTGSAEVEQGATIEGSVQYSKDFDWGELANPDLGGVWFMVGPVPVYLKFNLPITAGMRLSAQAASSVRYNGASKGTATFAVHCDGSCTGSGNWNLARQPDQPLLNADLSARIRATPWIGIAGRVSLYGEWLVYVQGGVRPELGADLWGYTGNNCGDADQTGGNDAVRALTIDLDGTLVVTAGLGGFGGDPREWDLWSHTWHLLFASLISDTSGRAPMVTGPASVSAGSSQSYGLSMRPCWPYDDAVHYEVTRTDGSAQTVDGPAHAVASLGLSWPTPGAKALAGRAVSDAHGRNLDGSTTRTIQVVAAASRNLARDAGVQASAQTTYPGYSAARTIDGSTNTTVGPEYGWANARNAPMPQWLQITFPGQRVVDGFHLYTSAQYEIQNYDIQAWNGSSWVTVVAQRSNRAVLINHSITPVTTSAIRVSGLRGPELQPGYVRVNELEIMGHD